MALIQGTNNSDNLYNPPSNDIVYLGGGDDTFYVGNGSDTVSGGSGADRIVYSVSYTSGLKTSIFGESGDDYISVFYAGDSNLYGGEGDDRVEGGRNDDRIFGGNDSDTLFGDYGNDRIYGEEGDDLIYGSVGSDTLVGGNGNDTIYGFELDYSSDSGFIEGVKNEKDTMYGGGGADLFVLGIYSTVPYTVSKGADLAYIEDFQSGEDKIQLVGSASDYLLGESGGDTIIYENYSLDTVAIVRDNGGLSFSSDFVFA